MEAENKLYADVHGDGQGQPSQEPPNYTPTAPEQQQQPQPGPSGVPSQPYPQYGPYPTTGTPFYAPPAAAGYGTIPVCVQQPAPRFTGAIIYACCVMWSCNWLFGLFAFGLALAATDWAASNPQGARKLGRASYIVSTAGIVTMVIIVAIVVAVYYNYWMCCSYYYCFHNVCYHHYSSNYTPSECQKKNGYYDGNTCWYN